MINSALGSMLIASLFYLSAYSLVKGILFWGIFNYISGILILWVICYGYLKNYYFIRLNKEVKK